MYQTRRPILILVFLGNLLPLLCGGAYAQAISDNIISEHVRLRIPVEREWLGREVVTELDRCWVFINGATGEKMPRRVLIDVRWDGSESRTFFSESRIVIGMNNRAAQANLRGFLLHMAARELGRMGLLSLSKGAAPREESEFLMEGMSEILAREYAQSTRILNGAWILAQLLDRMNLLGLKAQASWGSFSRGRQDLRAAAPGITFLLTCREMYGREKVLKFFESLRRGSLEDSISTAFKARAAAVEGAWLKRVREYRASDDHTAAEEAGPRLEQPIPSPTAVRPGMTLQLRLLIRAGSNALLPEGIYVLDEASGKVLQPLAPPEREAGYAQVEMFIEPGRPPGFYNYKVVAIDEGGNVRSWPGRFEVQR